jgi:hypothetical protein
MTLNRMCDTPFFKNNSNPYAYFKNPNNHNSLGQQDNPNRTNRGQTVMKSNLKTTNGADNTAFKHVCHFAYVNKLAACAPRLHNFHEVSFELLRVLVTTLLIAHQSDNLINNLK